MEVEFFPSGQTGPFCNPFAAPEEMAFDLALCIWEQQRAGRLASAELPDAGHVCGWNWHLTAILCLAGTLPLEAEAPVRFGADMKNVPIEEKIANFGERDLALTSHAVKKELEDHPLRSIARTEELQQFLIRIRNHRLRWEGHLAQDRLRAMLLFLTRNVLTACITL